MTKQELENLLADMSLEEKVGQMVQVTADTLTLGGLVTGPTAMTGLGEEQLSLVGSILGKDGPEDLKKIQEDQMKKQPHHIPMLFMKDVINGYETIFPIPLAQGCTFSPEMVEKAAAAAAKEAAAMGLHVTFSPMLDLVRDARWGRVMESTGEDPYLNSELGKAFVKGYQGVTCDLKDKSRVAACLKHFAAYGACEGGRDYDNVELSERTLREDYFPAYEGAVKAGCRMAMTSFNTLNRVPSSGNKWLLRKVLRDEMGFEGVVISDWAAVEEMVCHGFAKDAKEAARLAIEAGVDIDMVSTAYCGHLADLVRSGEVEERLVDEAVMRILTLKNDLGLFENTLKVMDSSEADKVILCEEHRKLAREFAAASFVLLKNENILPLDKKAEKETAVIGPYVEELNLHGSWSFPVQNEKTVTVKQGILNKISEHVRFSKGCYLMDQGCPDRFEKVEDYDEIQAREWLEEAKMLAEKSDQVILCLGEAKEQSGESASRTKLSIPEVQMNLLRTIHKKNENIVTVLFTGRPLEIQEIAELSRAVLVVWRPGTEGGNAIADILYGDSVPQGKLTMSFPRSTAQLPIYYNRFNTGRPNNETGTKIVYCNGYIDENRYPLYPFGYGLSYTTFEYSAITLSSHRMTGQKSIKASVMVKNIGSMAATETVQLYLRDVYGSVVRPMKSLKAFKKVTLQPNESKEIVFEITEEMLRFYNADMEYQSEAGSFEVYIGTDSETKNKAEFEYC